MSVQSDAAKAHIEKLLNEAYPQQYPVFLFERYTKWEKEYRFAPRRLWRFDYAVPAIKCAIELDGGTFGGQMKKIGNKWYVEVSGHNSPSGLRNWREKNNIAMFFGWRIWHYAPEEVIRAGRKTLPDEPILTKLPWLPK